MLAQLCRSRLYICIILSKTARSGFTLSITPAEHRTCSCTTWRSVIAWLAWSQSHIASLKTTYIGWWTRLARSDFLSAALESAKIYVVIEWSLTMIVYLPPQLGLAKYEACLEEICPRTAPCPIIVAGDLDQRLVHNLEVQEIESLRRSLED